MKITMEADVLLFIFLSVSFPVSSAQQYGVRPVDWMYRGGVDGLWQNNLNPSWNSLWRPDPVRYWNLGDRSSIVNWQLGWRYFGRLGTDRDYRWGYPDYWNNRVLPGYWDGTTGMGYYGRGDMTGAGYGYPGNDREMTYQRRDRHDWTGQEGDHLWSSSAEDWGVHWSWRQDYGRRDNWRNQDDKGRSGDGNQQEAGDADTAVFASYKIRKELPCKVVHANGTVVWQRTCFFSRCNITKPGLCDRNTPYNLTYCSKPTLAVWRFGRVCELGRGSGGGRQAVPGLRCNCSVGPVSLRYGGEQVSVTLCRGPVHYEDAWADTCRERGPGWRPSAVAFRQYTQRLRGRTRRDTFSVQDKPETDPADST